MTKNVKFITTSAVMLALATALAMVCAVIPFLNLPFGGGFTVASMLPIILIAYMYGVRRGLCCAFAYSLIQILLGAFTGGGYIISLFTVGSDNYQGIFAGVCIVLMDYILAYTVLGFGGLFRFLDKRLALVVGTLVALSLRYLVHIVSGAIFFGVWAEWFFAQDGFYAIGRVILDHFSGVGLSIVYSIFYNGLYMIPEIIITTIAASLIAGLPMIKKEKI